MDGGGRNEVGVGALNSTVRRKAARWGFELDSMFETIDDGGGAERKKERKKGSSFWFYCYRGETMRVRQRHIEETKVIVRSSNSTTSSVIVLHGEDVD